MTNKEPDVLDRRVDEVLERALPVSEPPADFVDRVMNVRAEPVAPRWSMRWVVAALAAGLLLGVGMSHLPAWPSRGNLVAIERVEAVVGQRATVVAESGAELSWETQLGGSALVQQKAGSVFYRVTPGAAFEVVTAAGTISVSGTCFRAELSGKDLLRVEVYEGSVLWRDGQTTLVLAAGEAARSRVDGPAVKTQPLAEAAQSESRIRLRSRIAALQKELDALLDEGEQSVTELVQEKVALREDLQMTRQALAEERAHRRAFEGEPVGFPVDLPEAYRQAGLLEAFERALELGAVEGDVAAIDCSEYPCIVYGQLEAKDSVDLDGSARRLREQLEAIYPSDNSSMSIQISRHHDKDEQKEPTNTFGIAVTPEPEEDPAVDKRVRHRMNQYLEATFEHHGEER